LIEIDKHAIAQEIVDFLFTGAILAHEPLDRSDKQKVEHANSPNPLLMEMVKEAQMAT
jgi:hypothetical protein